jgi:hypothetical protein
MASTTLDKMKGALPEIIGRTIKHVGVAEGDDFMQVILFFTDGTHYEFYGAPFNGARHVSVGDITFMQTPPIHGYDRLIVLDQETATVTDRLPG